MNGPSQNSGLADKILQKEVYPLNYKNGRCDLVKFSSRNISKKDKIILILAGVHGEEIAGPLTIKKNLSRIANYAHKNKFKIIVFPQVNPSGCKQNTRLNIDNESDYPLEFKILIKIIKQEKLLKNIVAAIDLHQDYINTYKGERAYQYVYQTPYIYDDIIKKICRLTTLLKTKQKASCYYPNGYIIRRDKSLTYRLYKLGINHCLMAETTGDMPLEKAVKINMIWIKGIIELCKKLCKKYL